MYRKFLVPLDGSELAEMALPYAEELAVAFNSEIDLLFVCDASHCQRRHEHEVYVGDIAKGLKSRIEEKGARTIVKTQVVGGHPAAEILDYAANNDTRMVVMATHGRSGIMSWALGSVANKVLHGATIPVLLVRAGVTPKTGGGLLSRVLLPLDGSEAGEKVIPYVGELINKLGSEVVLLQVVAPGVHVHTIGGLDYVRFTDKQMESAELAAKQYLSQATGKLAGTEASIGTLVRAGDPAQEIINLAEETDASLVALSSHGHSGIQRWTLGSVSHKVLNSGSTPVLLVRVPQGK